MKRSCVVLSLILVLMSVAFGFADDAKPLFEFDYNGSHIQTFGTYSIVDGKVCYTHRYFIKDGNLVVIDQSLEPTPTGIFIHFEGGKSYIAVLCKSGKIISLGTEDLCSSLKGFKNNEIKSLAETVSYDSRFLNFEYIDGSKRTYDCVTGELYSQSGTGAKKTAEDFFSEYFSGIIDRSTSMGTDTSGAKAQGVVNALNGSGATLEQLLDSGMVEGIEADYSGDPEMDEMSGDWSYEAGAAGKEEAADAYAPYDFTQDKEYQQLMKSKETELSKDEVDELRDLFAKISRGELSESEAVNLIPGKVNQGGEKTVSAITEETRKEIASAIGAVQKSVKAYQTEHKADKKFIEAKAAERYIAVYNAENKRYDIYSEQNLLENPEHPETEAKRIANSEEVDKLNRLLSSEKQNDSQRGMGLFTALSGAIAAIAVIVAVLGILGSRKKKLVQHEE